MSKKFFVKILLPLSIIIATVLVVKLILDNPPETKKRQKPQKALQVEVKKIKNEDLTIQIESYGIVSPSIETTLISQVSGKIVYVSENFENGGSFKKGDLLLKIEDVDYQADVNIASSKLILAEQNLLEEVARSEQAKKDWEKFNSNKKPSDLVLRIPQLNSAKANLIAAKAEYEKANLDLQRTKIYAPYDGRIVKKDVSIAQVIQANSSIASIYASNSLEARLPLKNTEIKYLDLNNKTEVLFKSSLSDKNYAGFVSRSESQIDTNTKQLYVIAKIDDKNSKALNVGEYLTAIIDAKTIKNVIAIPNNTIYQGSFVYVVKKGIIEKRDIEIAWQNTNITLVKEGLSAGENLVLTTLGSVVSGTKVLTQHSKKRKLNKEQQQ